MSGLANSLSHSPVWMAPVTSPLLPPSASTLISSEFSTALASALAIWLTLPLPPMVESYDTFSACSIWLALSTAVEVAVNTMVRP